MFDRLLFMLENLKPQFCDQTFQPPIQTGYPHQQYQQTPGYPAGHALQAQVLANYLSKKYPEKKELFNKLSIECDTTRVKAGLHYFSDGEFSRKIVKLLNIYFIIYLQI